MDVCRMSRMFLFVAFSLMVSDDAPVAWDDGPTVWDGRPMAWDEKACN